MNNSQGSTDDMPLSNDPLENLKLENELLAIKLRAEAGAFAELDENMVVNQADEYELLQRMNQLRTSMLERKPAKLYDILGRPAFVPVDEMDEDDIPAELEKVQTILAAHFFEVESKEKLIPTVTYRFITELLFNLVVNDFQVPGLMTQFVFEEFEAEFEQQMRTIAQNFMWYWSEQILNGNNLMMAAEVGDPFRESISQEAFYSQLRYFFDAYPRFHNLLFNIEYADFDWGGGTGSGMVVGKVDYEAEAENGEITKMKGSYALFMHNYFGSMCIYNIQMPGFVH